MNGCRIVAGCTRVHAMALDSPVLRAPPYGCDVSFLTTWLIRTFTD